MFFGIDAKGAQLIFQLAVIVAINCRQVIRSSIYQRRTAINAESFSPSDRVKDIIKAAQRIIHQAIADAHFCPAAADWHFVAQIIVMQVIIWKHPTQKKFIADPAGIVDRCLKAISVSAAVFIAIIISV